MTTARKNEKFEQIRAAAQTGKSYQEIADLVGTSVATVHRALRGTVVPDQIADRRRAARLIARAQRLEEEATELRTQAQESAGFVLDPDIPTEE